MYRVGDRFVNICHFWQALSLSRRRHYFAGKAVTIKAIFPALEVYFCSSAKASAPTYLVSKELLLKNNLSKIPLLLYSVVVLLFVLLSLPTQAWADDSKMLQDLDEAIQTSKFHFDSLTPEEIQRSSNQKLLELYSISSRVVDYCQGIIDDKKEFPNHEIQLKAQQCQRINYRVAKKLEPELRRRSLKYTPVKILLR